MDDQNTGWEMAHDPRVRSCIVTVGIPVSELRDDIRCPACDDLHRLMHLDPDVLEVLDRQPWCKACVSDDQNTQPNEQEQCNA